MARSAAWVSVLLLSSAVLAAGGGCSSGTELISFDSSDAGGSDSGSTNDGGPTNDTGPTNDAAPPSDAATSASCPASVPASGTACALQGMECEYGSDPSASCNTIVTCDSDNTWKLPIPTPGAGGCPTPPPATGGDCPSTLKDADGKSCSNRGEICGYARGTCACSTPSFGIPIQPDASTSKTIWVCTAPADDCPYPRPRIGSACSTEKQFCDYGACTFNGPPGVALECDLGAWQAVPVGCPAYAD